MEFVKPQLAHRGTGFAKALLDDPRYVAEEKWDGMRCLAGGTRVLTRRGYKPVNKVDEGEEVLTASGEFKRVTGVARRPKRRADVLVDVQPWHGFTMRLTSDHGCLTATGWTQAGDLNQGAMLVLPRPKRMAAKAMKYIDLTLGRGYTKRVPLTLECLWFLGLWVGDGSACVRSAQAKTHGLVRVAVNRNNEAVVKRVAKVFEWLGLEAHFNKAPGATVVSTYDSGLAEFLNATFTDREKSGDHVLRRGHGKTIPEWFDGLRDRQFAAFVAGWRAADGHGRTIDTVSEFLAGRAYRQMLLRGWRVSLHERRTGWTHRGERRQGRAFRFTLMNGRGQGNASARLVYEDDRILVPVQSVTRPPTALTHGDLYLYDLEVCGEENFVAATVLHNCQVHVENHRTQAVFSRTGRQMGGDGLQWIYALMWKVASATVDGEVCWPGVVASDVSARIAHGEEVNLELFDALALAGKSQLDREYLFRRALIEEIVRVQQDERVRVTKMSRDKRKLMEEVSVAGGEGLVMKHVNSVYLPGSRTKAWVKLHAPTRDKEYDVIVTGTTSKSTYERAQFRTGEATLTYGVWDPKLGEAVTVGQLSYVRSLEELLPLVGKVAVVKAKYQFSSGALRHGHIVCFRDPGDKGLCECLAPKDEDSE